MTAIAAPLMIPTMSPTMSMSDRAPGAQLARRRRRHAPSVYWRRRAVVLLLGVGAAMSGQAALEVLGGGPLTAAEVRPSTTAGPRVIELDAQPVATATYVVRSGDTLWTIAKRIQPTGDVRPLVDALADARDGRPLQPGERIVVP